jgi:hypothetical protein
MVYQCMPAPFLHPKTNTYYYRKQVPAVLREAVGKREIRIRLTDADGRPVTSLAVAKRLYPEAAAQAEAILAKAGGGPVRLTRQQIVGLVGKWYVKELAKAEADPPSEGAIDDELTSIEQRGSAPNGWRLYEAIAQELLEAEGLRVDGPTFEMLGWEIRTHRADMLRTLYLRAAGDYRPDPVLARFPAWAPPALPSKAHDAVAQRFTFEQLVDAWQAERKPGERGAYEFKRSVKELGAFVGHDDPKAVTKADIVRWKNHLLTQGKTAKTVNASRLAHIKAVFNWAVRNVHLQENPAAGVLVEEGAKKAAKKKNRLPYTDSEAKLILTEARKLPAAAPRFPYRKWLVFLLAYSGCRINELAQLMKADVQTDKATGIHYLDLNIEEVDVTKPAKGEGAAMVKSLKNAGSIRQVPIHPSLSGKGSWSLSPPAPP